MIWYMLFALSMSKSLEIKEWIANNCNCSQGFALIYFLVTYKFTEFVFIIYTITSIYLGQVSLWRIYFKKHASTSIIYSMLIIYIFNITGNLRLSRCVIIHCLKVYKCAPAQSLIEQRIEAIYFYNTSFIYVIHFPLILIGGWIGLCMPGTFTWGLEGLSRRWE